MRSKRAGARRQVLGHLRAVKDSINILSGWWNVTSTVYVELADRKPGDNLYLRERLEQEYPEAQRRFWAGTIKEIDDLTERLATFREHCLTEYHQTPEGD
jgi:hypothetical protein